MSQLQFYSLLKGLLYDSTGGLKYPHPGTILSSLLAHIRHNRSLGTTLNTRVAKLNNCEPTFSEFLEKDISIYPRPYHFAKRSHFR